MKYLRRINIAGNIEQKNTKHEKKTSLNISAIDNIIYHYKKKKLWKNVSVYICLNWEHDDRCITLCVCVDVCVYR